MPPNAKAPAAASDDALGLSTPEELGLEPVRHERFAERVYESLFHAIMTGKLAPDASPIFTSTMACACPTEASRSR